MSSFVFVVCLLNVEESVSLWVILSWPGSTCDVVDNNVEIKLSALLIIGIITVMFWFESVIPSFLGFSGDVSGNNSFGILVLFDMFGVVTGSKVDIIVFVAEEFAVVARINLVLIRL